MTTLINWWKTKRDISKAIQRIEAKQQAEEYRQRVEKEAYFLWEADGKPEGKDDYYWKLAIDKIKGNNIPTIYQPYYLLEKRILEPVDAWINKQAFFTILGGIGNLALVVAVVSFVFGENVRRNNEVFAAWQTITSANGQSGSGGRIEALEFLNSRPWRFPWIGWTEKGWYWDKREKRCEWKRLLGLRWERQPLVGLSAPNNAYLAGIHLCGADLVEADLSGADLRGADLSGADLAKANLSRADLDDADLSEAELWDANLESADLVKANLTGAIVDGANLGHVYLGGANLNGANLSYADLIYAQLSGTNLNGVNFSNASLLEAGFTETGAGKVRNLTPKQIKSACFWETARFDPEFEEKLKKEPDQEVDCNPWWKWKYQIHS